MRFTCKIGLVALAAALASPEYAEAGCFGCATTTSTGTTSTVAAGTLIQYSHDWSTVLNHLKNLKLTNPKFKLDMRWEKAAVKCVNPGNKADTAQGQPFDPLVALTYKQPITPDLVTNGTATLTYSMTTAEVLQILVNSGASCSFSNGQTWTAQEGVVATELDTEFVSECDSTGTACKVTDVLQILFDADASVLFSYLDSHTPYPYPQSIVCSNYYSNPKYLSEWQAYWTTTYGTTVPPPPPPCCASTGGPVTTDSVDVVACPN